MLALLLASSMLFATAPTAVQAAPPQPQQPTHPHGRLVERTNPALILNFVFSLPGQDPAGETQFLQQLADPSSPFYHHYLTPQQFASRFGPSLVARQTALTYLGQQRFVVTNADPLGSLIDFQGTVSQAQAAFRVQVNNYQAPDGRIFFANDRDPALDPVIAGSVHGIFGLSNEFLPKPRYIHPKQVQGARTRYGSGPAGGYTPLELQTAYDAQGLLSAGLNGSGQHIALFELDGYNPANIAAYDSYYRLTPSPRTDISVNSAPIFSQDGNGQVEVELDIEVINAIAPGAAIDVFIGPNTTAAGSPGFLNVYQAIASGYGTYHDSVISSSWGGCEPQSGLAYEQAANTIARQYAAQGQTFFLASGDAGSQGCLPINGSTALANTDTDGPYVTTVGGTTLAVNGTSSNATYNSETVWNSLGGASSGGLSMYWHETDMPWQSGPGVNNTYNTNLMRQVPDVSADADPITGYSIFTNIGTSFFPNNQFTILGGTSAASPLWAGIIALVNQKATAAGLPVVGLITPTFYKLLQNPAKYASNFHDITIGNNDLGRTTGCAAFPCYPANSGYDLATGTGSPDVAHLFPDLLQPLARLSQTWYFAEGYSGPNFNVYYTVFNPGPLQAHLTVTYFLAGGSTLVTTAHIVAPGQPLTFFANADVPTGVGFGARISSDQPIMAERSMYFQIAALGPNPPVTGASDVVGVTAPSTQWYFAEGYTGPGFNEFLTLINPNSSPATLSLTYSTQSGVQPPLTFRIPAGQRQTIYVNDNLDAATNQTIPLGVGPNQAVGASISSDLGIVVERPMYFSFPNLNAGSGGLGTIPGGHVVMGATSLGTTFNFAEGYTGANFNEFLTLLNPGATATVATVAYYVQGGAPVSRTLAVPAGTRQTISVWATNSAGNPAGLGQPNVGVSVTVTTVGAGNSVPILVERPMYFAFPNLNGSTATLNQTLTGGSIAVGSNTLGNTVVFAAGTTATDYNEFLTIENPHSAPANLTLTYYSAGGNQVVRTLSVAASSRATILVFRPPDQSNPAGLGPNVDAGGVSAVLFSDQPIFAERPEYMLATNQNPVGGPPALLPGGHDAVGVIL